jgi:uncharacterized protein (TIGR03437 family)
VFERWSNGGPASQEIVPAPSDAVAGLHLVAEYKPMAMLSIESTPVPAAVLVNGSACGKPCIVDGHAGDHVLVEAPESATSPDGNHYEFLAWSDGGPRVGARTLAPEARTLVATYRARYGPGEVVVMNAAGPTPVEGVASGSIVSIYGADLAPATEIGPTEFLTQTLAGVSVQVGDRILPLFFVSPGQINALLPGSLAEGEHSLSVLRALQPKKTARLRVVRNAPGLFASMVDGTQYASAWHEDGSPIGADSPAHPGELVTLLGTGFGPWLLPPPEGSLAPPTPDFPLLDPTEILAAGSAVAPEWAGAAPGFAGVTAVRFRLSEDQAGLGRLELQVRVNGVEGNRVVLRVGPRPSEL